MKINHKTILTSPSFIFLINKHILKPRNLQSQTHNLQPPSFLLSNLDPNTETSTILPHPHQTTQRFIHKPKKSNYLIQIHKPGKNMREFSPKIFTNTLNQPQPLYQHYPHPYLNHLENHVRVAEMMSKISQTPSLVSNLRNLYSQSPPHFLPSQ